MGRVFNVGGDIRCEVLAHAQIHDDILKNESQRALTNTFKQILTMGSMGIGLADISTLGSAAKPGPRAVHAGFPLFTQVM